MNANLQEEIFNRLAALEARTKTNICHPNFFRRAFSVLGHNVVAYLIGVGIFSLICLIFGLIAAAVR